MTDSISHNSNNMGAGEWGCVCELGQRQKANSIPGNSHMLFLRKGLWYGRYLVASPRISDQPKMVHAGCRSLVIREGKAEALWQEN